MNGCQVAEFVELVADWHVVDAVVHEERQARESGRLLAARLAACRVERAGEFTVPSNFYIIVFISICNILFILNLIEL